METELLDGPTEATPSTALTLPQRAAVALASSKHEIELRELVKASADIVTVNSVDGREQAHRVGMTLKSARCNIEKVGKTAREDAQAFAKAIIAEEKRLVEIVSAEEDRIFKLRDDFDAAEEAKRQAAIKAERERVESIQGAITAMRNEVMNATGKPLTWMQNRIGELRDGEPSIDFYQEFHADAMNVWREMLERFVAMIDAKAAQETEEARARAEQEAEAARLQTEREELEALRAQAAAAHKQAEAELAAQREAQERELAAQRAEIAQQQAVLDAARRARDAEERAERERIDAENRAKQDADAPQQATPPMSQPRAIESSALVNLGTINAALGFTVSAEFLTSLGFTATQQKNARLYREADLSLIYEAIARHVLALAAKPFKVAA